MAIYTNNDKISITKTLYGYDNECNYCIIKKLDSNTVAVAINYRNLAILMTPDVFVGDTPLIMLCSEKNSPKEAWEKWTKIIGKMCSKLNPTKYFTDRKLEEHLNNGTFSIKRIPEILYATNKGFIFYKRNIKNI